jgi:hypothetical protein
VSRSQRAAVQPLCPKDNGADEDAYAMAVELGVSVVFVHRCTDV